MTISVICGRTCLCMLEFQHHCLARTELYVMAYYDVSARCDIHGFLGITDYLGITLYVEFGCNVSAVNDGHDALAVILTRHHVNAVLRAELGLAAFCYHVVALTPMQQTAYPAEHIVLSLGASLCRESVAGIASPSAGEVLTHVAVCHRLRAVHQNLRAVIELRDAVYGQQQRQCLLQSQRVLALA